MTRPEWSQGGINCEAVIEVLLAFIQHTALISRDFAEIDAFVKTGSHFGSATMQDLHAEITAAAPAINTCMELIGGIHASWTNPNGDEMRGAFLGCSGFDIDTGKWELTFSGRDYSGRMSATPERLYEILTRDEA